MADMSATHEPDDGRLCVLLVEDHALAADVLARMLCVQAGYWVDVVGTAENALARLQGYQPDLVLIDIGLPGQNGIWLAQQLHRLQPSMPVLMLTGYSDRSFMHRSMAAGARGYVLKDDIPGILPATHAAMTGGRYISPSLQEDNDSPNSSSGSPSQPG